MLHVCMQHHGAVCFALGCRCTHMRGVTRVACGGHDLRSIRDSAKVWGLGGARGCGVLAGGAFQLAFREAEPVPHTCTLEFDTALSPAPFAVHSHSCVCGIHNPAHDREHRYSHCALSPNLVCSACDPARGHL